MYNNNQKAVQDIYDPVQVKLFSKLKLIFAFTLLIVLQVRVNSFAQITLKERSASLENILQKIRQQSNYDFFYNTELLNTAKPINIDVKNATVEEALHLIFKDQSLNYIIQQQTIILKPKPLPIINSQKGDMVVTGRIINEKNSPVTGATVKIKEEKNGPIAISGQDGTFQITAPIDAVLVIGCVGYQFKEIDLLDKKLTLPLFIELEDTVEWLNQTEVNSEMFKRSNQSFIGASTNIAIKELKEFGSLKPIMFVRNTNPLFDRIKSNIFGSNSDRLPDLRLRGKGNSPNLNETQAEVLQTPLMILDGFQSTLQKLLDINEGLIESITLLKDIEATASNSSKETNALVVVTIRTPKTDKFNIGFNINIAGPNFNDYIFIKDK